jgi:hypothetical protein
LSGNSGISSFVTGWVVEPSLALPCRCETARDCVERGLAPLANVVKLDVEGHELALLRGFGSLIESPELRVILFEGRGDRIEDRANEPVVTFLVKAGFTVHRLERSNSAESGNANFLASRGELRIS